jgi:exopolyphosphatase/guanosine-5'-triphosphate,3'-diphosphate pyrophosphatase
VKRAAIDIGSNTLRMLILDEDEQEHQSPYYYRRVTRLAGDFTPESGLATASMDRTLAALQEFAGELQKFSVNEVRAVGTAALRDAINADKFVEKIRAKTGIQIEIIDGEREAELSCRGILSVLSPVPHRVVFFDIGGGSTEIICYENRQIQLRRSVPLGVVRLCENHPDAGDCLRRIQSEIAKIRDLPLWTNWHQNPSLLEVIGTAGTVTTLAALKLKMHQYEGSRVNNLILKRSWLNALVLKLTGLSLEQRRKLPGMEAGRADLILPGLQIVLALLQLAGTDSLRAADAGLLEGILLE